MWLSCQVVIKWHAIRQSNRMEDKEHAKVPLSSRPYRPRVPINEDLQQEIVVERRKVIFSAIFAAALVAVLWVVKLYEYIFDWNTRVMGLRPRTTEGLLGVITEPLVHGDINHLVSNSVPLFLLMMAIIYFYRGVAFRVLGWIWILTGVGVWIFARSHLHIGASGVVYGLASFLAVSGFMRNDSRLMSISLLVVFLYGGMVWGVLPLFEHISWESHLMGGIAGVFCAIKYRKEGPQQKKYFEDEEEDEEFFGLPPDDKSDTHSTLPHYGGIQYHYLPKQENDESKS